MRDPNPPRDEINTTLAVPTLTICFSAVYARLFGNWRIGFIFELDGVCCAQTMVACFLG